MKTAVAPTRGICNVCCRSNKVRVDGNIGAHKRGSRRCSGSGQPPQTTMTHVAVLLDRSSSMSSLRSPTIKAFNAMCEPIRSQGNDYTASYYTFGFDVKREFFLEAPSMIPIMKDYAPYGNTAMYDCIGRAVEDLCDDGASSYLLVIITDGEENSSKYLTAEDIGTLIREKQLTDRWTFAISCPRGFKRRIAERLNIPDGNIAEWEQTTRGAESMGVQNRGSVGRFVSARATGQTCSNNFHVNVGREDPDEVIRSLEVVPSKRFRRLRTTAATQIQPFIESKKLAFRKGRVFYALQKKEKVQSYKEIILERRDTGILYSGPAVRRLLGIPVGQDGQISPGNLGEFIVWVQSTSVNRKLLAKMDILFDRL